MGMLPQSATTNIQAAQAGNRVMPSGGMAQRPDIRMILQQLQQRMQQQGQRQGVPRRQLPQMPYMQPRPQLPPPIQQPAPQMPQPAPWTGGGTNMSMFQPAFNQQPGFQPAPQAAMPQPINLPGQMQDPGTVQIGGITVNKGWFDPDSLIGAGA